MQRLLRTISIGGLLAFVVLGFESLLPLSWRMQLLTIRSAAGAALPAATLAVVFALLAYPLVRLVERGRPGPWRAVLPALGFMACLALFTAASQFGQPEPELPWLNLLLPHALSYGLAGVLAAALWRSPWIVLPALAASAPLGVLLPLAAGGFPALQFLSPAMAALLWRVYGLSALTGVLAGATAWALVRLGVRLVRASKARSAGPAVPRLPGRARRTLSLVILVLAIAARLAWILWPARPVAWRGGHVFEDAPLAALLAPDRPVAAASLLEARGEAFYVATLRERPPRHYADEYLALLRARGIFIHAMGGSAHAPRPADAYRFLVIRPGVDREAALSLRYREFWDRRRDEPAKADPFWWPLTFRPYASPVRIEDRTLSVRLGDVRSTEWHETWPLPEHDEQEASEFPFPRFPGAVVRDWGPETEDRELVEPAPRPQVQRLYVARAASPEQILAHYSTALESMGLTPSARADSGHSLERKAEGAVGGLVEVVVETEAPGLVWGRPLESEEDRAAVPALLPRLAQLTGFRVSVRFERLDAALAFWPHVERQRRELLLAAQQGRLAGRLSPALLAPTIAVLDRGRAASALEFFGQTLGERVRAVSIERVSVGLLAEHRVLVIPTGGLAGLAGATDFAAGLRAFVESGGVVVSFCQGDGHDYQALPVPAGQRLRAIGSASDQSVYARGVRVDRFHPVLASVAEAVLSMNVDGVFEEVPEQAQVLFRKTGSELPVFVLYPCGHGWVVVTSSFDDCPICQRIGPGQPAVLRDLLAWARDPADLPFQTLGVEARVRIPLVNRGSVDASAVALRLRNPARDAIVAEATLPARLAPAQEAAVEWKVTLAPDAPRGIHHVSYALLGQDGRVVQAEVESDSGRLAVGQPISAPGPIGDLGITLLLPDGEDAREGQALAVECRLDNRIARPRRLRLYWNANGVKPEFLEELALAPRESVRTRFRVRPVHGQRGFWVQVFEVDAQPKGEHPAPPGETAAFKLTEWKGFRTSQGP